MAAPRNVTLSAPSGRTARTDGDATRLHMLDVAGRVFAERGYADATSKEICARAGTNAAAVNYHFGSRDGLYEAVLVEAHHHLVGMDDLMALASQPIDPAQKLRKVLSRVVGMIAAPDAHWGTRVLLREILSPTAAAPVLVRQAILPKLTVMAGVVGEIMGLPATHPAVRRGMFFTMAPCFALLLAPSEMRQHIFPALKLEPAAIAEEMVRHVLAGLSAQGAHYRGA